MDLKNKVILITGASRGIGAATALLAAKEGAKVIVDYNSSKDEAEKVVQLIKTSGGDAVVVQADILDPEQIKYLVDQSIKTYGQIDVLINNAGVYIDGYFKKQSASDIDTVLDTNLRGLIHLTNIVIPLMIKRKDGVIVNISSQLGKRGGAGAAVYSASKFGVIGFTQSLGRELVKDNIRVYAVCPGHTATEMGDFAGTPVEKVAQHIINCAKEELNLSPGQDTEIYS